MGNRNFKDEEFSNEFDDTLFEHFIHSIKIGNIEDAKSYFIKEFSNRTDKYGLQPIHWASLSYNVDILKWLLTGNCDIESASRNGWRPIHFATFVGDEEMVKCLIENYCKLDCPTDRGETISDVANGDCEHEFFDEILNETNNLRVALSMGLKCSVDCDHKLCLTSVTRGTFYKGELIGRGSFANVYKVRESQSDRIFALITDWKDEFDGPKYILSNINRYLTKLDHENMIKYYGKIKTTTKWKIFMEWMEKGSLENEIRSTLSLSDDKIARFSKDILQALAFLHHNKIIHRDINPRNILIDSNGTCKFSISHLSCSLANDEMVTDDDKMANTYCGTPNYMAPEIIIGEPYNYLVDIWSVGATVIHMLTGHPPYHNLRPQAVMFRIGTTKKLEYIPPCPISNEMQQFIDDMTKPEPKERPTTDRLLNYEFIRNASINCEINNSNTDQSIIDHPIINPQRCTDLIRRTINNQQIGLSMNLECPNRCKHEFCLSSVTAHNFQKGKRIGSGAFGNVYKINKSRSSPELVIKIINKVKDENIEKEAKCLEYNINEYRGTLDHENIVKYFGAISDQWEIFIFMEFIGRGSIADKMTSNEYRPLPETTIKLYTKQILKGLKFLHGKKIIHRDIKSQNILLTKTECVKIADFGCSRFLQTISKHQQRTFWGTAYYLAPEIANDEPYDCPVDIWSVGATVFEMATGRPPFFSIENEIAIGIKIAQTRKLEESSLMGNETKKIIDLMTKDDPNERLTADQLLNEKYLE